MKKLFTAGLAAVAMLVASSTVQADVIHDFTDGSTFAGGTYGAMAQVGSSAGVNITLDPNNSGSGAFESLANLSFNNNAEVWITVGANTANTASSFNVLLLDEDGPTGGDPPFFGEAYLYNVDLTGLTPGDAPVQVSLGTLADFTAMNPGAFGHQDGNGILDFLSGANEGLYEWQIQGADDGGLLDITVAKFEIKPAAAIPEPTSLALVGLGALGLVARRRR